MSRNKKERTIGFPPLFTSFKPVGVAGRHLSNIILTIDEYEAIRLADFEGFNHDEAATEMNISRSTFTRLIEKARRKTAQMIISGNMITIEGGNIHFRSNIIKCNNCGHMFKIKMNQELNSCPNCDSTELFNLAGNFGHGKCCTVFFND
ncbi:MAG TPA: DUF134 domain-containing protein [Bacteroidetes bacterium]|nr:DUF134 domain-containing protein [Bacteroidota bacterium]